MSKLACLALIDADGHLQIGPQNKSSTGFIRVRLGQSYDSGVPPELIAVQKIYGGTISRVLKTPRPGERQSWELAISVTVDATVLRDLIEMGIIRKSQAMVCNEFLERGRHREHVVEYQENLQRLHVQEEDVGVDEDRLVPEYLAGLFAADGSVFLDKSGTTTVSISKPTFPAVLHALVRKLGYGVVVANTRVVIHGENADTFLRLIQDHIFGQKVEQVQSCLQFRDSYRRNRGRKRTASEIEHLQKTRQKMKEEKKK